jgi:hypothetical protein
MFLLISIRQLISFALKVQEKYRYRYLFFIFSSVSALKIGAINPRGKYMFRYWYIKNTSYELPLYIYRCLSLSTFSRSVQGAVEPKSSAACDY